jgi:hypothetical protein
MRKRKIVQQLGVTEQDDEFRAWVRQIDDADHHVVLEQATETGGRQMRLNEQMHSKRKNDKHGSDVLLHGVPVVITHEVCSGIHRARPLQRPQTAQVKTEWRWIGTKNDKKATETRKDEYQVAAAEVNGLVRNLVFLRGEGTTLACQRHVGAVLRMRAQHLNNLDLKTVGLAYTVADAQLAY